MTQKSTKTADYNGQHLVCFNPFGDETQAMVVGRKGSGKSATSMLLKKHYMEECEQVEQSSIQFYR